MSIMAAGQIPGLPDNFKKGEKMSILNFITVVVLFAVLVAVVVPLVSRVSPVATRHEVGDTDDVQ